MKAKYSGLNCHTSGVFRLDPRRWRRPVESGFRASGSSIVGHRAHEGLKHKEHEARRKAIADIAFESGCRVPVGPSGTGGVTQTSARYFLPQRTQGSSHAEFAETSQLRVGEAFFGGSPLQEAGSYVVDSLRAGRLRSKLRPAEDARTTSADVRECGLVGS